MAPLLSGGGYSSEAIAFSLGLANSSLGRRFAVRQFAVQADEDFASGLPPKQVRTLGRLLRRGTPLGPSLLEE